MRKFFFSLILTVCTGVYAEAQSIEVNKRFGKVSDEEVMMTSYDRDTSASALILYENTDIFLNINASGQFSLERKKHVRIKVLKEDGVDWGDFELIHLATNTHKEAVTGIEVITYNMEEGKVVSTKMPKKYVFREDYSENYDKLSFSAQDVKVGSVIEVKYVITSSRYWRVDDVFFQRPIPVNLAECNVRIPDYFSFNKKMNGYIHVDFTNEFMASSVMIGGNSLNYNMSTDKYRVADVPAFRKEPYVYNSSQYISAVHYDIRSLTIPGAVYEDFSVDWADVDESYADSDIIRRFRGNCQYKDEVAQISSDLPDEDKILAAVNIVNNAVQWDKSYDLVPKPLAQTVKSRTGSNADKNSLVAGCLRELGFVVDPVFIRLRSSGVLMDFQPEMNPYDTFILSVTSSDGTVRYLDCGSPYGYINILNPLMLVTNGRIIHQNGTGQWVDLTRLCRSGVVMYVNASVDPASALSAGNVSLNYFGEDSYQFKAHYNSFDDEEEYMDDLENDHSVEIQELEVKKDDEYSKDVSVTFTYSKPLDSMGEIIYIDPFFEEFHSKDSFQSITRDYPVDFPYTYSIKYSYVLQIPDGYSVEELPKNQLLKLDALDASVRVLAKVDGNRLQLSYTYTQNQILGTAQKYNDIRDFWQHLGGIYDSMIVLKKNS